MCPFCCDPLPAHSGQKPFTLCLLADCQRAYQRLAHAHLRALMDDVERKQVSLANKMRYLKATEGTVKRRYGPRPFKARRSRP